MRQIRSIMIVCSLLNAIICTGQFNEIQVKETWDYMAEKKPYNSSSVGLTDYALQVDPYSVYGYGEALGFACEGYMVIYEVTKDKAYLIHALNRFLVAVAWRKENLRFNNSLNKDGILLWTMAHWTKCELPLKSGQ